MPRKKLIGPDVSGLAGMTQKEKKVSPEHIHHIPQVGSVKARMPTALKQSTKGKK